MPRKTIEYGSEKLLSPRDIWRLCKDLQPGEWLDKLFYLAIQNTQGTIVPVLVKVGADPQTEDKSKLVFLFHIDDDNVFAARATRRSDTSPNDIEFINTYTYQELIPGIEKLARKGKGKVGFVEVRLEKRQTRPSSTPVDTPAPSARQTPFETSQERLQRVNRDAFRTYIQEINNMRSAPGFEKVVYGIIEKKYNQKDKLSRKIATITSSDAREYWGEPSIELRASLALPSDDRPTSIEAAVERVQKTLTIRILYGTHTARTRDEIVSLHETHIQALAAFFEELKNLNTPRSLLRERLQNAGFKQVRLEFAVNVENSGEMEYRVIRLEEVKVPEK